MKLITAIIQPTKLLSLRESLKQIGVDRITVCDAQGFGRQKGKTPTYRGIEYKTHLLRKVFVEIAVEDEQLEQTLETIASATRSLPDGNIGDGKVFVMPLSQAISIEEN